MQWKPILKTLIPNSAIRKWQLIQSVEPLCERICPICDYFGWFDWFGSPPRIDAKCPGCNSLERHRLFKLYLDQSDVCTDQPVLHFAPEAILANKLHNIFQNYISADLYEKADLKLDIEDIAMEDNSVQTVICNHVLEHVDDRQALLEIFRILKPGGKLIASVPIIEGWGKTYENKAITSAKERTLHYGQSDHIRYYGQDFRDCLLRAGFSVTEYTAHGEDIVKFSLLRGETIFDCSKPATP